MQPSWNYRLYYHRAYCFGLPQSSLALLSRPVGMWYIAENNCLYCYLFRQVQYLQTVVLVHNIDVSPSPVGPMLNDEIGSTLCFPNELQQWMFLIVHLSRPLLYLFLCRRYKHRNTLHKHTHICKSPLVVNFSEFLHHLASKQRPSFRKISVNGHEINVYLLMYWCHSYYITWCLRDGVTCNRILKHKFSNISLLRCLQKRH